MGLDQIMPPGEDWISRRFAEMQTQIEELRAARGLEAASISSGGLRLLDDAFFKMMSGLGFQIVYIGPSDVTGKQIIELRRHNGSLVLRTAVNPANGEQYWAMYDRNGNILLSDDSQSGYGLANPWLSIPMYPLFSMAQNSVYQYMNLPVSSVTSETILWSGRIPQMHHGFIGIDGLWGAASGSNSSTYRLKLNGTQVGTWNQTGLAFTSKGPYDAKSFLNYQWVAVELTVQASGTGSVAAQVFGCACRGS